VSLASLLNLRDVGGLSTGDGRIVRHGRLLRGATPYFLTEQDARELVEQLGVGTRIDLRGPDEVADGTSAHLAAIERHVAHVPLAAGGAWTEDLLVPDLADRVSGHYLRYLEHSPDAFVQIADIVSAANAPVLVHCAAGKDRTGAVIALILSAVGVLDSEIVADYGRTRDDLDRIIDQLGRAPGFAKRMARLPAESQTRRPRQHGPLPRAPA
jgi:protein tyrosine/serine phosphatase